MSLLTVTQDFTALTQIADKLVEVGDEIPHELEAAISDSLTTQSSTVTRYCQFLNHLDDEIEAVEREIKLAREWIEAKRKKQARMLEFIRYIMQQHGLKKLEGNYGHKFQLRRAEAVRVDCQVDTLPEEFINREIRITPSKSAIKGALKSGRELPGCIIEQKESLNYC